MKHQAEPIHYNHQANRHGLEGPAIALPAALNGLEVSSILDVGCGTGTWLAAARGLGIKDLTGLDGIIPEDGQLHIERDRLHYQDFRKPWSLERSFDLVLCLEVAEHLEPEYGRLLVDCLTRHTDLILFSAGAPFQDGDHHVNCQWPLYWQDYFNSCGFSCSDAIRWELWNDLRVEPWYRQNLFIACRSVDAGKEPRLKSVYHPEMIQFLVAKKLFPKQFRKLRQKSLFRTFFGKDRGSDTI
jgi:SAM-dependent methyltransferase